jgi:hypothetical protein
MKEPEIAMQSVRLVLVLSMIVLLSDASGPLYAYLDPGTGSMVVQAIFAAVVGAIAIVKVYWTRIKRLVGRSDRDKLPR